MTCPRRPRRGSGLLFVHGRGSGRSALPGRRSGEVVLPGRGSGEDDLSGGGYSEEEALATDPARCGGAGIRLGTGSSVGSRMGSPTGSWVFFLFFLTINRGGHPKGPAAGNRLTAAGKAARRGKAMIYRDLSAVADAFARCGKANSPAAKNVSVVVFAVGLQTS